MSTKKEKTPKGLRTGKGKHAKYQEREAKQTLYKARNGK